MHEIPEKLERGEALGVDELLECLPALKEVPPTLLRQFAVGAAVRRRFREGEIVCHEGDFGSTAFYIVSGHVDIYLANPLARVQSKPGGIVSTFKRMTSFLARSDEPRVTEEQAFIPIDASVDLPRTTPLAWLGPGELIGEMTCRTFQPRSATVRATDDCVMVEMLRVILDMLLGTRDPDAVTKATTRVKAPTFRGTSFKKEMDDRYRERSLVTHLRSVPLFATLDIEFFDYLKEKAELVSCNKGEIICKQGDPADAFYLIRTGLVRVAESMPGGEMVRTYRKRGEYFGEAGLIFDQPRAATCSALDAVDLVKISKEAFRLMLARFPVVRATLEKVAAARIESMKEKKLPVGLKLDEFLNQGLFEAQNLLLIDLDNCTRCDACVNACADAHDGVTRLIRDGLRYDRFLVATACRSCRDPLCMTQCPVGSIRRKESLEIIIEDWCIGCTKCAELCPYGNINMVDFKMTRKQIAELDRKEREKEAAKKAAEAKATSEKAAKAAAAPAPSAEAAKPSAVKPADAPVPKPSAPPAPAPPDRVKPPAPKKAKNIIVKATTCDLCTELSVPSCVYACPHDAAKRVDPTQFLAAQIGRGGPGQRFRWLPKRSEDRTTH